MERRSTNDIGYVHFQGDVVSNVGSSHGVRLGGGSTGGVVEPFGDDTSIGIVFRAKNAGPITIGNSTQAVTFGSTAVTFSSGSVVQIGSTAPFAGLVRAQDTAVTTPALFNDTDAGRVAETTHTVTVSSQTPGTQGPMLFAYSDNLPVGITLGGAWYGSTADQVHTRMVKGTTAAIAGTTCTISFLFVRF